MLLQTGDTLAGYKIEGLAGVGGMATVYRATQLSLDRPVALKVLSTTLVGNRTFRERFRREGRHAAALDHPNIIPVYEAGESNGLMFIAMRLVDGPSLAEMIIRDQLTGGKTIELLRAVASALDTAHAAGLVHRDIKPQNILVTSGGHPYLADFGITKAGGSQYTLTRSGDFVGSISYTSPEQIEGADVTKASDIYSLTAVLFQCLSGTLPYELESDAAVMRAHLAAPPPALAATLPEAPVALDEVFARGMDKEPVERFASAVALVEAAAAALQAAPAALDRAPAFDAREHNPEHAEDELTDEWDEQRERGASGERDDRAHGATPGGTELVSRDQVMAAQQTYADQRRPVAAAAPPVAPKPRLGMRAAAVGGATLVLAAAVGGYLAGRRPAPRPPVSVRSAAVALLYNGTWATTSGGIDGIDLSDPVALRNTDGVVLVAGRLTKYAPGFSPLPAALAQTLSAAPVRTTVTLDGRQAVRYTGTLTQGGSLWAAFLPDSRGWTAIACTGHDAGSAANCPTVALTLRAVGAAPAAAAPNQAVARRVSSAIGKLNGVIERETGGLSSKSTEHRAAAAASLASAYQSAAGAMTGSKPPAQEALPVSGLARALLAESRALKALGRAAKRRDRGAYNAARKAARQRQSATESALTEFQLANKSP